MKGSPSKPTALKIEVTGPENIPFAGVSMHLSAPEILRAGSVKGLN